ncbi:DgyrCDS7891 [Dimorphilus gyrociliatus]|uniref:DgyrCDS7891 n=1 Tax=Dimorphilus gyrociliatus TaxID=2664684 RepID=A0A7I8VSH2_9ANNE|nr:DgyrCDS7891 [Dimorphilus gyrociliatus]
MSLALDQQFLEQSEGKNLKLHSQQPVPAIHPTLKKDRQFLVYFSPPVRNCDEAEKEEWMEFIRYIIEDLQWLLKISHQQFWVQIIFDVTCQKLIESFLCNSPRPYDNYEYADETIQKLQHRVYELVFKVCLRFSTHKESNEHFLTPKIFGDILYENFIWDIPKLFDFCSIYAASNEKLVNKVVHNIFNNQTKYNDDLKESIKGIGKALDRVTEEIFGSENEPSTTNVTAENNKLEDIIHYLLDTSKSIEYFLTSHEESSIEFFREEFHYKIADFYSFVLCSLAKHLAEDEKNTTILQKLSIVKYSFIINFRKIIYHGNLKELSDESKMNKKTARTAIEMFQFILEKDDFAKDYCVLHDFSTDSLLLWKYVQNKTVHERELAFLTSGFDSLTPVGKSSQENLGVPVGDVDGAMAGASNAGEIEPSSFGAEGIDITSYLREVKEILPDLRDNFIREQLEIYDNNVERVVQAVLEGNAVQSEVKQAAQQETINVPENIRQRANIFDGDEFDIFSRNDIDVNKIHKGKKEHSVNVKDQEATETTKTLAVMYEIDNGEPIENEYDDEYDDTYDAHDVGAQDNDSEDDYRRSFVIPRVLAVDEKKPTKKYVESDDETEEDVMKKRLNFCEDPAVLRERAAERRASQMKNRQPYRPPNPNPQSQEKNRSWKEKHKSSQGNHNRRFLADKKRKF